MKVNEDPIRQKYEAQGYTVFRNGWPDFLIMKDGEPAFCVEVKTTGDGGGQQLSPCQVEMHAALKLAGLPTRLEWVECGKSWVKETEEEKEARLLKTARSGGNKKHGNGKRKVLTEAPLFDILIVEAMKRRDARLRQAAAQPPETPAS